MLKESQGFGDQAVISLGANAISNESVGIEGHYVVECRDANGNLKWSDSFPNLVNAVGKQLLLNTLLTTSGTYTTVGPFLGLISGASPTFAASDTMTSHCWLDRIYCLYSNWFSSAWYSSIWYSYINRYFTF